MKYFLVIYLGVYFLSSCTNSDKASEGIKTMNHQDPSNGSCLEVLLPDGSLTVAPDPFKEGGCSPQINILGTNAPVVKKCDPYYDTKNNDPNQYTWYFYASKLSDNGSIESVTESQASILCNNIAPSAF